MAGKKFLRAIDLYSGVGGWSLGLRLAGIDVVASYEWWNEANATNSRNNQHEATECDIRALQLGSLPSDIDIVVGSPPCTEFSYANRGGGGDIADGLRDIECFLRVVTHLKPSFWAMENVPRVAGIVEKELARGGALSRFASLKPGIEVLDACEWGVPQRRKRCIIGNIDFDRLRSYRGIAPKRTLGDVVWALRQQTVKDPVYGVAVPQRDLLDHEPEEVLNAEEERMNREMKTFHPVYNNMPFPDPMDRPARTVTAVCTRVSRESLVIDSPEVVGRFRRLTVRERGCLQSFPVNYRFYGSTYSNKLRMVGNAVPPLLTCFIAHAMLGTPKERLPKLRDAIKVYEPPSDETPRTPPETGGQLYPATRRFRAALPNLRFKSGVRFELSNSFEGSKVNWSVRFFFGSSKEITEVPLEGKLVSRLLKEVSSARGLQALATEVERVCSATSAKSLQAAWCHAQGSARLEHGGASAASVRRRKGAARTGAVAGHPYHLVDALGACAAEAVGQLAEISDIEAALERVLAGREGNVGFEKLRRHAVAVYAGLLVGCVANRALGGGAVGNGRRETALA